MNQGFTLIESLLYIALFAIIIGGALVAVYQMIESSDAVSAKNIVEMEGSFLLRKIDWALTGAETVNVPNSTTLEINKKIEGCAALVFLTFTAGTDSILLSRNSPCGNSSQILTSEAVKVKELHFLKLEQAGKPIGISASTTISSQSHNKKIEQIFETTKYLRK